MMATTSASSCSRRSNFLLLASAARARSDASKLSASAKTSLTICSQHTIDHEQVILYSFCNKASVRSRDLAGSVQGTLVLLPLTCQQLSCTHMYNLQMC